MSFTKEADYTAALKRLVQVSGFVNEDIWRSLQETDWSDCIQRAVVGRYSDDRPRTLVLDIAGDGTTRAWTLTSQSGSKWREKWSAIVSVEFPQGSYPPIYRRDGWVCPYLSAASAEQFLTTLWLPASGDTVRLQYTAPHEVTAASTTVFAGDHEALVQLAGYYMSEIISAQRLALSSEDVDAASVELGTKSEQWARWGSACLAEYEKRIPARVVAVVIPSQARNRMGEEWATHQRRD